MEMNLYQAVTAYQYAGQNETRKQAAAVMLEKTKGLRKFLADKFHGIYGMRELDSRYLSREDADRILSRYISRYCRGRLWKRHGVPMYTSMRKVL